MDSTIGILSQGYTYFSGKFEEAGSDVYETTLLFRKTICIKGEEAARLFYDQDLFRRAGATPGRFKKTLFGKGGVQGLDGKAHEHRKQMFMQCMSPESMKTLRRHFLDSWSKALSVWITRERIVLFHEAEQVLAEAACRWVGVPLQQEDLALRTGQLSAMIDAAGGIGIRHFKGRLARRRAERWIERLVRDLRKHPDPTERSILRVFSDYRDMDGHLLDERIVAVEVLNLLRPLVAIARYITFAALALHEHPRYREKLKRASPEEYRCFVQEVRRFYPFFPVVAATVRKAFEWRRHAFPKGVRVLLDLYATNHDARLWESPQAFIPERFLHWEESPFSFIPQGGGDHSHNHRCAGEWITIDLTQAALKMLTEHMQYEVPRQQLQVDLARIPAIPESRLVLQGIRRRV